MSSKEAAAVAKLPLPPSLERLDRLFAVLNTVYCFLQLQNVQVQPPCCEKLGLRADLFVERSAEVGLYLYLAQATWSNLRAAIRDFPGAQDATLDDVSNMAQLCPEVVYLHDKRR